jgi:hypothetical protein
VNYSQGENLSLRKWRGKPAMRKKKIVFREYCITVYTDGTIDMDGFDKFFNKKMRYQISQLLSQASID